MRIDRKMRAERALEYLRQEQQKEVEALKALENIHIREIIIIRNKKFMYLAEVEQMIRNLEAETNGQEEKVG